MRKIFILIIAFFFLSIALITDAETACDRIDAVKCGKDGGAAVCDLTATHTKCVTECDPWAWPHCDCKSFDEGGSECWCECNDECADQWCKDNDHFKGRCKDGTLQCCEEKEIDCSDEIDNDCDDKIDCQDKTDCEAEVCGSGKVCKNGSCVDKESIIVCLPNCELLTKPCLCGKKEIKTDSGEFCCGPLSKKYTLKADCDDVCKPACPEDCDNLAPVPCYCDSKLIEVDEEKYCFRGKVYTDQKKCKEAEAVPPEEEEEEEEEFICLPGAICIENPLKAKTFEELVNNIVNFIYKLALLIAPIMFIIAGLAFITAAGDPAKIKQAKDIALWTAIGLMVVLMATGIIKVIQEIFET